MAVVRLEDKAKSWVRATTGVRAMARVWISYGYDMDRVQAKVKLIA